MQMGARPPMGSPLVTALPLEMTRESTSLQLYWRESASWVTLSHPESNRCVTGEAYII